MRRLCRLRGEELAERIGFQRGGTAVGPSVAHAQASQVADDLSSAAVIA